MEGGFRCQGPSDNKDQDKLPRLKLVLRKKKIPFPPIIRKRGEGGGAGCLLLASPWAYRIWEHWERMEFGW